MMSTTLGSISTGSRHRCTALLNTSSSKNCTRLEKPLLILISSSCEVVTRSNQAKLRKFPFSLKLFQNNLWCFDSDSRLHRFSAKESRIGRRFRSLSWEMAITSSVVLSTAAIAICFTQMWQGQQRSWFISGTLLNSTDILIYSRNFQTEGRRSRSISAVC